MKQCVQNSLSQIVKFQKAIANENSVVTLQYGPPNTAWMCNPSVNEQCF